MKRPPDDPANLIGEAAFYLLDRQDALSDGDLAEAQRVVPLGRQCHRVDHADELIVRDHALPHQQAAERLRGRVIFSEHQLPGLEVQAHTHAVGAHVEDTRAADGDELTHRLDQGECIAALGGHLVGRLTRIRGADRTVWRHELQPVAS